MRIYLVGFMGSGKSHWGKLWATAGHWPFYDLDAMIEADVQKSIEQIFEQDGEPYFRMKETVALHSTLAFEKAIISCGGGTACFHDNMDWMNHHGMTVYLSASPQMLLDNIMKEGNNRPLLKKINPAELLFFIQQKLEERLPFYHRSTLTLHAEDLNGQSLQQLMASNT